MLEGVSMKPFIDETPILLVPLVAEVSLFPKECISPSSMLREFLPQKLNTTSLLVYS
jgi:hypothetical protein